MQEQDLFSWLTCLFGTGWRSMCMGPDALFRRSGPEFVFVVSSSQFHRPRDEEITAFFERRSYFERDEPDKHRRTYQVSRRRPARRSDANRIINENIKSNEPQPEEEPHDDSKTEHKSLWQASKMRVRALFASLSSLFAGIWFLMKRLRAMLHDQSIWVFQQRRIQQVIGHKAECAVLSQRNVLIVNQGDVVTGDCVLLALKSRVLSNLLHSVERSEQNAARSYRPIRYAEYSLDQWWPPYI